VLGQYGIPLGSQVYTSDGKSYVVSDLLADAMARFRSNSENEWTALAIIFYADPARGFKNRFNDRFCLTDIGKLLVVRQVSARSCFGTHANYALTVLQQRNAKEAFLSASASAAIEEVLRLSVNAVTSSQQPDGSISPYWYHGLLTNKRYVTLLRAIDERAAHAALLRCAREQDPLHPRPSNLENAVLCTAHHLEWLFLTAPNIQPGPEFYARAVAFLQESLVSASDDQLMTSFCGYTHAIHVLLQLDQGIGGQRPQGHLF